MYGSEIYNDFLKDILWIRERIQEEIHAFPNSSQPLVNYYIKKRLTIIPDPAQPIPSYYVDYHLGRPIPYVAFWFATAFGLKDRLVMRKLGLGLVYSALATTIRDDIIDKESSADQACLNLFDHYHSRYLEIFADLFDRDSKFWHYFDRCIREHVQYDDWNLQFNSNSRIDPFSELFLQESSRYFSAVVMPTLVALAIIMNSEEQIPKMHNFLRHYSMGWRIYDDFIDWTKDLKSDKLNHSSILLYILQKIPKTHKLTEETVLSMFLNPDFIDKAYGTIIKFNKDAKRDIRDFNCVYLSKFMDEQISFHTRRRDSVSSHTHELTSTLVKQLDIMLNPSQIS